MPPADHRQNESTWQEPQFALLGVFIQRDIVQPLDIDAVPDGLDLISPGYLCLDDVLSIRMRNADYHIGKQSQKLLQQH